MAAVAEAARNLSCVGAEPLAVTDNLNFPSPQTPTGYWQLALACRGLAEACRELGTPVTGGNVSLYNETRLPDGRIQPIQPTPVVGMVGLVHDLGRLCGLGWREVGASIWLVGLPAEADPEDDRLGLAGSSYQVVIHQRLSGRPPRVDLGLERRLQVFLRQAIAAGQLGSAHDLSDGGLAVAAAECCLGGGLGARLELLSSRARLDRILFAEAGARVLVSVPAAQDSAWRQALANAGPELPATRLGQVTAEPRLLLEQAGRTLLDLPLERLRLAYEEALPRRLCQAGPPPEH
jgi:phosphoribosylformylglycinamidine synthase